MNLERLYFEACDGGALGVDFRDRERQGKLSVLLQDRRVQTQRPMLASPYEAECQPHALAFEHVSAARYDHPRRRRAGQPA